LLSGYLHKTKGKEMSMDYGARERVIERQKQAEESFDVISRNQ
jgi:hypothetical protein